MYKKGIALLSGLLLMTGCGDEANEAEVEMPIDGVENVESKEVEENVDSTDSHLFDNLVNETTFTEEYGLQAWEDYQTVIEDVRLGEALIINQENGSLENLDGSSSMEIEELFGAIDLKNDAFQDGVQVSDYELLNFYRYPPAEDSGYNEVADFLAELTFYYYDDNLMFTAITPGLYSVDLNHLPNAMDLQAVLKVAEIEAFDPQVYTIAQMQINGDKIDQIMIPAMSIDEEGKEILMAFYFFTRGEEVLQYAFLPFEMVSQDFPTSSILIFNQVISELETL